MKFLCRTKIRIIKRNFVSTKRDFDSSKRNFVWARRNFVVQADYRIQIYKVCVRRSLQYLIRVIYEKKKIATIATVVVERIKRERCFLTHIVLFLSQLNFVLNVSLANDIYAISLISLLHADTLFSSDKCVRFLPFFNSASSRRY